MQIYSPEYLLELRCVQSQSVDEKTSSSALDLGMTSRVVLVHMTTLPFSQRGTPSGLVQSKDKLFDELLCPLNFTNQ